MEVAPARKLTFHGTRAWQDTDVGTKSHSATFSRRRCILTIGPKDAETSLPSCMCAVVVSKASPDRHGLPRVRGLIGSGHGRSAGQQMLSFWLAAAEVVRRRPLGHSASRSTEPTAISRGVQACHVHHRMRRTASGVCVRAGGLRKRWRRMKPG